jgi:hypothetical protein
MGALCNECFKKGAVVDMTFRIDDAFISKWHPKYDETENDEQKYQDLVDQVAQDLCVTADLDFAHTARTEPSQRRRS